MCCCEFQIELSRENKNETNKYIGIDQLKKLILALRIEYFMVKTNVTHWSWPDAQIYLERVHQKDNIS